MSSIKVSALPDGSLPLVGDELVMIVQSGASRQVPASAFVGIGIVTLGGETTLVALAGNNNDVAFGAAFNRLLVNTAAGVANITGIAAGVDGQICIVTNQGPNDLTLVNASGLSGATAQLYGITDITLPARSSMLLQYSATLTNWVMV